MTVSFPRPTPSSSARKGNRKIISSSKAITSAHQSTDGTPSSPVEMPPFRSTHPPILQIGQYLLSRHRHHADNPSHQPPRSSNCLVATHCSTWNFHDPRRLNLIHSGYEDYQRYASDKRLNHDLKTQVLRD